MTDPLSVAAGIAGLISLGIQVTESLAKFRACTVRGFEPLVFYH
jgi:hypothetical protein